LLQPGDPVDLLRATLRDLGQLVHARRMLLLHLDTENTPLNSPVVQWHASDLPPLPTDLLGQLKDAFPWLWQQMLRGESVLWHAATELPETASLDLRGLAENDVDALALFPMLNERELAAVLICTDFATKDEPKPDNLRILQLGANLIENMLRLETILASLEKRVADRTKDLTALFDFTMLTSQTDTTSDMLEPAIRQIADTTRCQAICVHLFTPEQESLTLTAQLGLPLAALPALVEIKASPEISALLNYTEKQVLLAVQPNLPSALPPMFNLPDFQTYLGSQLRVRGKPIGFLSAYRVEERPFTLNEVSLLVILAEQLGILVENHHLQQQAEEMAIVGERQRLARELHDSISQSLYSQTLFARAARYALEDNDAPKLVGSLRQLESGSMSTLKEMRLLLFQMKPLALQNLSLPEAIEQRFNDVERRLGIRALCQIPAHLYFHDDVISELYRLIMEALNNSLKHAEAEEVSVMLHTEGETATLTISDNGVGFDLNEIHLGMGLGYMCDRTSQIQGHITMESSPGNGTRIIIQLPIIATQGQGRL
jgi:signal transduction histidine kinase